MSDMRIQVGNATAYDISSKRLHLIKSPSNMGADIKDNNFFVKDYPEKDGDDVYVNTTPKLKSFDYEITFAYYDGENSDSTNPKTINQANAYITEFYNSLLGKQITIYNDYKKQKIVGYVKAYKNGEFYRNSKDIVIFSVTFYVPKPSLCNFLASS